MKLPPRDIWIPLVGYQLGIKAQIIDKIKTGIDTTADVLRSGTDMAGKILDIMGFWFSFAKLSADVWKHALNAILDEARNAFTSESALHVFPAPPLVITPSPDPVLINKPIRKFVESFQIATEVQPYYLPGTGIHIPGVYTYGRQDLYPYYKIIRDSILDPGDVNAPRFDSSRRMGILTAIGQLGVPATAILDLARIRHMLPRFVLPALPTYLDNIKISAAMTEQGAYIAVDPDPLIRVLMTVLGRETSQDDLYITGTYTLLRTISSKPEEIVVCKKGTIGELVLKNFVILDEEAKDLADQNIYYTLEIEYNGAKITSRRVALFGGVIETPASIPPDWEKLSVLSAISPPGVVKDIIAAVEGIVNYVSAIVGTSADISLDMIEQIKNMLSTVKDYISLAQYLLDTICTAIKNLAKIKYFINYSIINGDTASLIDYYHNILVDNPPDLKIDREDNLIFLVTTIGATEGSLAVLGDVVSNIKSASQSQVELYMGTVDAIEKNAKEFEKWLEQTQITLRHLGEMSSVKD